MKCDKDKVSKWLSQLHLPSSWAEWVEEIELTVDAPKEGPYTVHRPQPPEREYESIEEDWDGEEETVTYTTHVLTDLGFLEATLNYEMALHRWNERHGDVAEALEFVAGQKTYSVELSGHGRKLRMLASDPKQGWMLQSWECYGETWAEGGGAMTRPFAERYVDGLAGEVVAIVETLNAVADGWETEGDAAAMK